MRQFTDVMRMMNRLPCGAKWRLALLAAFSLLWLAPFFWVGRMGSLPFRVPTRLLHQYGCSGLFTKRTFSCIQPLVQVRHAHDPAASWKSVKMPELSPLAIFGYRPRVDRLLRKITSTQTSQDIRQRLAVWISQHYEEAHAEDGKVVEVRFAQNRWPVNCAELTQPAGHWVANPAELGPSGRFEILATFEVRDGGAVRKTEVKKREVKLKTPAVFARRPEVKAGPSASRISPQPDAAPNRQETQTD